MNNDGPFLTLDEIQRALANLKDVWLPCDQTSQCGLCGWIDWTDYETGEVPPHPESCPMARFIKIHQGKAIAQAWANAWKKAAKQRRAEAEAFWSGGLACVECSCPTNNGICTECRYGLSSHMRMKEALKKIVQIGCMQYADVEQVWCNKETGTHSCYCPAGIALEVLLKIELNKVMSSNEKLPSSFMAAEKSFGTKEPKDE